MPIGMASRGQHAGSKDAAQTRAELAEWMSRRLKWVCGVRAGGLLQGLMFPTQGGLGRLGNSIAWWLGIRPYELFLYVFLPPLLLDAAVRIDWFLFKRVLHRLPPQTLSSAGS